MQHRHRPWPTGDSWMASKQFSALRLTFSLSKFPEWCPPPPEFSSLCPVLVKKQPDQPSRPLVNCAFKWLSDTLWTNAFAYLMICFISYFVAHFISLHFYISNLWLSQRLLQQTRTHTHTPPSKTAMAGVAKCRTFEWNWNWKNDQNMKPHRTDQKNRR